MLEFADEFNAKLSGCPEDYGTFAHRNTTIANDGEFHDGRDNVI
jgi:hypothetical protein